MSYYDNMSIDQKLSFADTALTNSSAVQSALEAYGYDEDRLDEGQSLLDNAYDLHTQQKQEYGEQFAATDSLNAAWREAHDQYMRQLKIARIALRGNRGASEKLALDGERKKSLTGWLGQARLFYQNILADATLSDSMAQFGIDDTKLSEGQNKVNQVEQALSEQKKEIGDAQDATEKRDAALDDLDQWMSDFISIARIALEEEPQKLESLGIVKAS